MNIFGRKYDDCQLALCLCPCPHGYGSHELFACVECFFEVVGRYLYSNFTIDLNKSFVILIDGYIFMVFYIFLNYRTPVKSSTIVMDGKTRVLRDRIKSVKVCKKRFFFFSIFPFIKSEIYVEYSKNN